MLISITAIGRVTADLELKTSTQGNSYLCFNLAVNKGFGEKQHPVYLQCWLFGEQAQRMVNAGVKKGSLIEIVGNMDIVNYEKKDGTKTTIPKVSMYNWNYLPSSKAIGENTSNSSAPAAQGKGLSSQARFYEVDCNDEGLPL